MNKPIHYSFLINDKIVYKSSSSDLIYSFNGLISEISKYFTLRIGDLIFTGSSPETVKININDRLAVCVEDKKMLDFQVK